MMRILKITALSAGTVALLASAILLFGIVTSPSQIAAPSGTDHPSYVVKHGDQQLAYLLVKLVLKTRAVIAGHYTQDQSSVPGVNAIYSRWMARNLTLPAAVADQVFSEVVPGATGDRAWVKMVVDNPRNPHNRGDATALELLRTIRQGAPTAEQSTADAYYYAEPIKAKAWCMRCHGQAPGDPDPLFPQFKKDGWHEGDIIGAVVARVAPEH